MQKGFVPILIVLLIVVVVGGATYYLGMSRNSAPVTEPVIQTVQPQPTPASESAEVAVEEIEEISSWKTFTYINNEFSFKYPNNWIIDNTEVADGAYINFFLEGTVAKKTENMHEFGNEVFKLMVYGDEVVFNGLKNVVPVPKDFVVGGKVALKGTNQIDILIGTTSKKVLNLEVREPAKPYIDQILSTFKFTN